MNFFTPFAAPGFAFLFLFLIFWPLEWAFPAKPEQKLFRPDWLTDFCFFLGQYLLWVGLTYAALGHIDHWLHAIVPSAFRDAVAALPWGVQALCVVVLSDVLIYWGHRLQHRVNFLWRFHATHHTAEHLDWLAAHREHPVDTVYTMGLINLPALLLGFPLHTIAALIIFRGLWAIYIHSNIKLSLGPLDLLLGSPHLHHWHHAKDRNVGNYANLFPLMDVIFGTHVSPKGEPENLGINEPSAHNYLGHMLWPFKPRGVRN